MSEKSIRRSVLRRLIPVFGSIWGSHRNVENIVSNLDNDNKKIRFRNNYTQRVAAKVAKVARNRAANRKARQSRRYNLRHQ